MSRRSRKQEMSLRTGFKKRQPWFRYGFLILVIFGIISCRIQPIKRIGEKYYISSTGSDQSSGTSSNRPWRTISKINEMSFGPGDHILFHGGETFEGTLRFDEADLGSPLNPIVISTYGKRRATIDAGGSSGIILSNTAGFEIKNLIVKGNWKANSQTGNEGTGIHVYTDYSNEVKRRYIRIDNVEVKGYKHVGISIDAMNGDEIQNGFEDVQITNCIVHDNGGAGIATYGDSTSGKSWSHKNLSIGHCKAYNNKGLIGSSGNSGNGIVISNVDGAVIERCVAYNNGELNNHPGEGPIGIWAWCANDVTIQHNESYSNKSRTRDGGGFDLDGGVTNSVMQYNYSHDNDGAGYGLYQFKEAPPFHNNVVRYNISQNNGRKNGYGGITIWNGGTGISKVDVYNNTIFMSPAVSGEPAAVCIWSETDNVRFFNNILVTTQGLPLIKAKNEQTGMVWQGNCYWPSGSTFRILWQDETYSSLSEWQSAAHQERLNGASLGYSVDPKLIGPGVGITLGNADRLHKLNAYRLQTESPLVNSGLDLFRLFGIHPGSQDFYGTSIPQGKALDIGAHEHASFPLNSDNS
ncbi:hypothetical protein AC481_00880 [miscellaneous Crenarchaeota group archaeon SMTZ-80]|nr:MAG: hypothetical protein AC481_00880 [miscellaneous Crenarchaeota group archaeon SMTZ-80]